MSTEFYCEEFPAEQNGKPVQTLKDLLEACPEDRFHFMTPFGYVDLTAQDAEQLRQGAAAQAHTGESGWECPFRQRSCCSRSLCPCGKLRMVNGTQLPPIRSQKWQKRSRCRRCSCDGQPLPRRRARVGGLCGFRSPAGRVPAERHKTGRCANVRERCRNGKRRRRNACGRLSAEGKAASGKAGEKAWRFSAPAHPLLPAVRAGLGGKNGAFLRGQKVDWR